MVSSISYDSQGTNSTYYSYDLSGNVKTIYQKVSGIDQKRIDYDYDLISGKVNMVAYQHEQADRFYYEYDYDTENRLTRVYSSRNGVYKSDGRGGYLINKERDARYHYYLHGPLARIEYAKPIVQGVDYAYTLQGWLKGINSSSLGQSKDIGKDGLDNTIPEDVLSYSLDYYQGDYQSLGNTAGQPFSQASSSKQGASLYNGNIRGMGVNNKALGNPYYNSYRYDQLNRLKQVRPYTGLNTSSNSWEFQDGLGAYQENFSYDANGNIQKLNRTGASSTRVDSLIYSYPEVGGQKQNNRLRHVKDLASSTGPDIGNQIDDNYAYDAIGNLTSDQQSGLNAISWNVYGKIKSIDKTGTAADISYAYDAAGNRVKKTVGTTQTYYIRDAQGNTLAVYKQEGSNALQLEEQQLYGSSRLGVWKAGSELTEVSLKQAWQSAHKRGYELSNHLGNVLSVISGEYVLNSLGVKEAVVMSAEDYYAFGSTMPERNYSAAGSGYRYGFNGKENDNEVKGTGNSVDFGERIYDSRLGGWMSVDPLAVKYPSLSPYVFVADNPILFIDLDGRQITIHYREGLKNKTLIFNPDEKYIGRNKFVKAVYESYKYLNDAGVADPIKELVGRKENIDIRKSGNLKLFNYSSKEKNIYFNPESAIEVETVRGGVIKGRQTPALGLLHEIAHALDDLIDEKKHRENSRDIGGLYNTKEEERVITKIETPAAIKLGEGVRDNHDGSAYRSAGPTTTETKKEQRQKQRKK